MLPTQRYLLLSQGLIRKGLVGWWKFNEGAGTSVLDHSGKGNNGSFGGSGNAWGVGGLTLNGSGWVDCGSGASIIFDEQVTMMAVIKYTASGVAAYPRLINKESAYGMTINSITSGGSLRYLGGGADCAVPSGGGGLTANTIMSVAEVCTDTLITGYKNGVYLGETVVTNAIMTSVESLKLGNRADATRGLNGTYYYALLYDRLLSAKEIAQNHKFLQRELSGRGLVL